ncbi:hypothetical protein ACSTLJ_00425, partial [Vibrio parahaemolyticus]
GGGVVWVVVSSVMVPFKNQHVKTNLRKTAGVKIYNKKKKKQNNKKKNKIKRKQPKKKKKNKKIINK